MARVIGFWGDDTGRLPALERAVSAPTNGNYENGIAIARALAKPRKAVYESKTLAGGIITGERSETT
jgi:hypothetical protein